MALTRAQRDVVIDEVANILRTSKSVIFVNFHGLTMEQTTKMRRDLADSGISYVVAKKTLTKRAIEDSGLSIDSEPELEGELAIAYGDDETAAAREIYRFQKEYDGAVSIQGGVFEGKLLNSSAMTEIAQIPGMLELRGMFVNLINSPIQRLAIVMSEIAKARA